MMRLLLASFVILTGCGVRHVPISQAVFKVPSAGASWDALSRARSEAGKLEQTPAVKSVRAELSVAQQSLGAYVSEVAKQTEQLNATEAARVSAVNAEKTWHSAASQNARERDVVLILTAVFVSIWFGSLFAGELLRNFPAPWSFIAAGMLYVGVAVITYASGRLVLHAASRLIP